MGYEYKQPITNVAENVPTPSPDDIQAALDLIKEDPALSSHPRVAELIESNFVTEDGRQLDPGHFLARVKSSLEQKPISEKEYNENVERIMNALIVPPRPIQ